MTAPTPPRPAAHQTPPPPLEVTVEPPPGSPLPRFTLVLQLFAHGEAADYLAARIRRWDLRRGGRPVAVSAAALARLPAWAVPQIEAALFGEQNPLAEDE